MTKVFDNLLHEITSLEDVKKIEAEQGLDSVINSINSLIPNMVLVKKSCDDIFSTICFLKENMILFSTSPFVSEQQKYIYILTKLDGKSRVRELEISDEMYNDKDKATKWRNKIANYVHPDKGGNEKAFIELQNLYETMIDNKDEE